jgi:hypothetical protein
MEEKNGYQNTNISKSQINELAKWTRKTDRTERKKKTRRNTHRIVIPNTRHPLLLGGEV